MKILYGMYQPDSGAVSVNGREVRIRSPKDALALGIGMIHQHFTLVPVHTVWENVVLGLDPSSGRPADRKGAVRERRPWAGSTVLQSTPVPSLPIFRWGCSRRRKF